MQIHGPLDALPLWAFFGAVLLLVLLSVEAGYRLGRRWREQSAGEVEGPVGAMVGATLGLLAFMLAFTFGAAAERYDSRRQILLDEANAIGTAYLRAGMLPDRRQEVRALLREYVDTRLQAVQSNKIAEGIRKIVCQFLKKLDFFGVKYDGGQDLFHHQDTEYTSLPG